MDFSMDNIAQLLDSMRPEDLQSLQQTAQAMFGGTPPSQPSDPPPDAVDPEMLRRLTLMMGKMQRGQDERTALIAALKPYLSAPRRKRAEDAMQFLRLLDVLPLLQKGE